MYVALGVGALVLVLLLAYAFTRQPMWDEWVNDDVPVEPKEPLVTTTTPDTGDKTTNTVVKPKSAVVPVTGYQKAVETYEYQFQFSKCQGNPGTLTFKQGVKVLFDNRDEKTHVIGFGASKFTIKGYGYVIATAPKPGTYNITCDGGGAAKMVVQK